MKIAMVCDWYAPRTGGVETQLTDLSRALAALGHEIHVITATPGAVRDEVGVVHRLEVALLPGWHVIRERAGVRQLDALLARERFDVVHAHSLYSPLALAATWLARRRGLACVLSSHSLLDTTSRLVLRSLARSHGWGRWADVLTAPSAVCAEDLSASTGRRDVRLLPNGLDAAAWTAPPRPARAQVDIVSVLRLTRRKRPLALVGAMREVARRCRHARLTVIGDGPLRLALERELRTQRLQATVRVLGALPRDQVRAQLAAADVFVLPSVKEAFGIAVLEARAAGLPVVTLRGSGAAELVEHGHDGLLADDDAALASCLTRLCGDAALRRALAGNAARGLERFAWPRVAAQHLALYGAAIDGCARRRAEGPASTAAHAALREAA